MLIDTPVSSMCCMSSSVCMPISNGTDTTTLICCSDDQGCSTFPPIPCDLQLQNDTATPTGVIKTVDFSPLEPCAGQCCPHGYSCNGTICSLNADQSPASLLSSSATSLLSAAQSQSSSMTPTITANAMFGSTTASNLSSSSGEISSSLVIDTSMVSRPLSSQPAPTANSMSGSSGSGASQASPAAPLGASEDSGDQSYKKLILPITISAVATWLILVFIVWKVLKRRKRRRCDTKQANVYLEKPPVPMKDKKKWSSMPRFELTGEWIWKCVIDSTALKIPFHLLPIRGRSNPKSELTRRVMKGS